MLDHMCDESVEYRKHFHEACGERLCGVVNAMQAQILLTLLFGRPNMNAPHRNVVDQYSICQQCKIEVS